MIAHRVIFEGRVQGVGFRYSTKQLAHSFEVIGWVRNLPDGTVELQLQGQREEVEDFLRELREESSVAHHIKKMHLEEIPLFEDVRGFAIC